MAGENENQDPEEEVLDPGSFSFSDNQTLDPETAFMRNAMAGEYDADKVFYKPGETPETPPATPPETPPVETPLTEPVAEAKPETPKSTLPEGLDEFIEKGDTNAILSSVFKAAGKEYEAKKSVRDLIVDAHPDIVFDSDEAVIQHVQKQAETAATLQKSLQQWDTLLDRVPKFKEMLSRLAEDPELTEDTLALTVYDDLLKIPEDLDDEELTGLRKSLKSSREQLEKRIKAKSEVESRFQEQVDYHQKDIATGVKAFMESHTVDQDTANKVMGVVKTILFGDQYGNRMPASKLLPIVYRGVYFDRLAKAAEPDAKAVEEQAEKLAVVKVNKILDDLRKKGGDLSQIPKLDGGQIPAGPPAPQSEFAGIRDPHKDTYHWN